MKTETYNAIVFLDLEADFETMTELGEAIGAAYESGDTAELGRLYFKALNESEKRNKALQDKLYRDTFALATGAKL